MNDLNQISTYIIKGKKALNDKEFHSIYDQSFKAWHETWDKTYKVDFQSSEGLTSDEFTRQDEILALFLKGECLALIFFSHVKMNDLSAQLDSYFQCWPETSIKGLTARGERIIICSQFTVCEKFRREGIPVLNNTPWKVILMGMLVKYFIESGMDAMTGTMRVSKGMDKLTYQFGATPLIEKMEYQAGPQTTLVDLVAFYQNEVRDALKSYEYTDVLNQLWLSRNPRRLKIAA